MTDSAKLDLLIEKISSIDNRLQNVENRLQDVDNRLQNVENKLQDVDNRLQNVENRLQDVEINVKDIKLTLENEIRVNIQRVAEGHLDLSRNMHEVMKPNNEIEMLSIKVRMLETDIRELKQRIS